MTAPLGAVHPQVARAKYDREVEQFARDGARHRALGVLLLEAEFPTVLLGFAAPRLKPAAFVFGMLVDYTDYDLQPPSVRFVDPFTGRPLTAAEVPTKMMRTVQPAGPQPFPFPFPQAPAAVPPGGDPGTGPAVVPPPGLFFVEQQPLLQDYGPDTLPFLCLPGVREYHDHPGHSGDAWELHRPNGAGALARLADVVRTYAVDPVGGWSVTLVPQVFLGYGEPPP
jgi:hypothetical protein